MAIAADDPRDRAEQLLALTERLTGLLAAEAEAYEAHRPHHAHGTAEETQRLANIYRHESTRIKRDPSLLEGAPVELKQRLAAATAGFQTALGRHARAVEAALTITEGIVKAVADEVASSRTASAGYGPGARAATAANSPIALNRKA